MRRPQTWMSMGGKNRVNLFASADSTLVAWPSRTESLLSPCALLNQFLIFSFTLIQAELLFQEIEAPRAPAGHRKSNHPSFARSAFLVRGFVTSRALRSFLSRGGVGSLTQPVLSIGTPHDGRCGGRERIHPHPDDKPRGESSPALYFCSGSNC